MQGTLRRTAIASCVMAILLTGFVLLTRRHAVAQSQTVWTTPGTITNVSNQWEINSLAAQLSSSYTLNGCPGWGSNYVTESSDGANQLMQAIIVGAYLSGKQVSFALNGCDATGAPIIRVVSVSG